MQWIKATGARVLSDDRKEYLDFTSGVMVSNAGHGHPHIVKKITACLRRPLLHCYKYPFPDKSALTSKLVLMGQGSFAGGCYCATGAEAVETSLRLCFRANARNLIVSFRNGFHGKSMGAGLISDAFRPRLPAIMAAAGWSTVLDYPIDPSTADRALDFLNRRKDRISGLFVECVQGSSLQKISRPFLQEAADLCARNGIVLVIDEIQTGFYRLGSPFAYLDYGIRPNLVCAGKGLTSSLPLAVVLFDSKLEPFYHPDVDCSTHAANPLSVAAALACLEIYETPAFQNNLRSSQAEYTTRMNRLRQLLRPDVECISHGTMFGGLVFTRPVISAADRLVAECVKRGLFVAQPVGKERNIVKFVPPLAITKPELREAFDIVEEACREAGLFLPETLAAGRLGGIGAPAAICPRVKIDSVV